MIKKFKTKARIRQKYIGGREEGREGGRAGGREGGMDGANVISIYKPQAHTMMKKKELKKERPRERLLQKT